LKLKEDLALVRPTLFCSVPRIFLRLYLIIKENLEKLTGAKKMIYEKGYAAKLHYLKNDGTYTHKLWDNLIFNKTKQLFGGRCRYMLTASAPISGDILEFLKIVVCCPVLEGYG
jgi:long-chain acyl-CoA synthetase